MDYFLFRKIVFWLAIFVGIGSLLLLGKVFLESQGERPVTSFPIESSPSKDKAALPPFEGKTDLPKVDLPKAENDRKITKPTKNLDSKPSAVSSSKSLPPITDLKPTPLVPKSNSKDSKDDGQKTTTVKSGASIYSIAAQTYKVANTSVIDLILELNPKITNPNKLLTNQKVKLPKISNESLIFESTAGTCKIWLGTFLKAKYSAFLKRNPALQGKEIEIIPREFPNGESWYRVLGGEFESREECFKVIEVLKKEGASPFFKGFKQRKE